MSLKIQFCKSKAKHSYLSLNKTSPGKLISEICKNFFFSNKLLTTGLELELEPEPPS